MHGQTETRLSWKAVVHYDLWSCIQCRLYPSSCDKLNTKHCIIEQHKFICRSGNWKSYNEVIRACRVHNEQHSTLGETFNNILHTVRTSSWFAIAKPVIYNLSPQRQRITLHCLLPFHCQYSTSTTADYQHTETNWQNQLVKTFWCNKDDVAAVWLHCIRNVASSENKNDESRVKYGRDVKGRNCMTAYRSKNDDV